MHGGEQWDAMSIAMDCFLRRDTSFRKAWSAWFDWHWLPVIQALRAAGARGVRFSEAAEIAEWPIAYAAFTAQLTLFAQLGVMEWQFACMAFGTVVGLGEFNWWFDHSFWLGETPWPWGSYWPSRLFSALSIFAVVFATIWLMPHPSPAWLAVPDSGDACFVSWLPSLALAILVAVVAFLCAYKMDRCWGLAWISSWSAFLLYVRASFDTQNLGLVQQLIWVPFFTPFYCCSYACWARFVSNEYA